MRYKKDKVERVLGKQNIQSARCHRDKEVRTGREPACAPFRKRPLPGSERGQGQQR